MPMKHEPEEKMMRDLIERFTAYRDAARHIEASQKWEVMKPSEVWRIAINDIKNELHKKRR